MTRKSKKMITKSRDDIARFLPEALEKAFQSYHHFMGQDVPEDAKGFGAHHTAAKVAIAHIELLMKLAALANLTDADDHPELQDIIQHAQDEYNKIATEQGDEEDE
jgi:hypothetical protein